MLLRCSGPWKSILENVEDVGKCLPARAGEPAYKGEIHKRGSEHPGGRWGTQTPPGRINQHLLCLFGCVRLESTLFWTLKTEKFGNWPSQLARPSPKPASKGEIHKGKSSILGAAGARKHHRTPPSSAVEAVRHRLRLLTDCSCWLRRVANWPIGQLAPIY